TEYVGGLVGYVGLGTEIYGRYVNNRTVTASGDYIGGFIGQLMAGAGKQDETLINPTFYLGNSDDKILGFENNGIVSLIDGSTASYVGGIIGGAITNTGDNKDYLTILTPEYMRNMAPIAGTNYVGGFIGELSDNVALKLSNYNEYNSNGTVKAEDNWSYNGKKDSDVDGGISGTANYVGGLVGKMGDESHQIIGVFNTMKVHSQGGNFVGGLVGEMVHGTIDYCFVTIPGTTMITADVNLVHSTNPVNKEMGTSVGGLVGNASGGSIRNSYVQGFSYDVVDSSRGGVAGTANTNVSIENAWALYITNIKDQTIKVESDGTKTVLNDGVTYKTTADNINGQYILTYGGRTGDGVNTHAHATATISEMLVFAGLKTSADLDENNAKASNNEVLAMKGMISLGLNLPAATNAGDAKERIQLTFYDASGYENPFLNPFDGAANDEAMSNLYIRLNANADSSLIIAATAVHFGTVENYDGKEAWQDAYSNIGDDELYKLDVKNGYPYVYETNADGTMVRKVDSNGKYVLDTSDSTLPHIIDGQEYKPEFQAQYGYDYYSDEATNDPDYEVKYVYTSVKVIRTYGQKSEVAPLVISTKADWIAFAQDVRDEKYYGKTDVYVKLATDLIGGDDKVTASDLA
ncbi:MAG: hypothetical protein J6U74_02670, partial [Clostridia bacterium]|nr:hypothetical protein [Clostridia bacterium]